MSEWLRSNKTRAFPFIKPVADLDEALLDAVVTFPEGVASMSSVNTQQAVVIEHLDLAVVAQGSSHVAIGDNAIEGGTTLFDSRVDSHTFETSVDADFLVAHWFNDEYSVKLVFDLTNLGTLVWPQSSIVPLTSSTVILQSTRVTSVVADGTVLDGDEPIILDEGYNCELKVYPNTVVGTETRDIIKIAFVPGAGDGKYEDCVDPESVIRRINGLEPDALGNFNIAGDDCIFIRPLHDGTTHGLDISSYCSPCCSCEDMVLTYEAIKKALDDQHTAILPRLYNSRDSLSAAIAIYNTIYNSQVDEDPSAILRVYGRADYICTITVIIMNPTESPLTGMTLTFDCAFDDPAITTDPIPDSGFIFSKGKEEVWTPAAPTDAGGDQYTRVITVPKNSWRGYQFEIRAEVHEDRQDLTLFTVDLTTDVAAIDAEQESCSVIKPGCGGD